MAKELKSYNEIKKQKLDCLMICVTNTPVALNVAKKIKQQLDSKTLVIDLTTHNKNGATKMDKIFKSKKINYNFCGVMGGPVQSEQGILGGIYGGKKSNFLKCKKFLNSFCKSVFNFGDVSKCLDHMCLYCLDHPLSIQTVFSILLLDNCATVFLLHL